MRFFLTLSFALLSIIISASALAGGGGIPGDWQSTDRRCWTDWQCAPDLVTGDKCITDWRCGRSSSRYWWRGIGRCEYRWNDCGDGWVCNGETGGCAIDPLAPAAICRQNVDTCEDFELCLESDEVCWEDEQCTTQTEPECVEDSTSRQYFGSASCQYLWAICVQDYEETYCDLGCNSETGRCQTERECSTNMDCYNPQPREACGLESYCVEPSLSEVAGQGNMCNVDEECYSSSWGTYCVESSQAQRISGSFGYCQECQRHDENSDGVHDGCRPARPRCNWGIWDSYGINRSFYFCE